MIEELFAPATLDLRATHPPPTSTIRDGHAKSTSRAGIARGAHGP
jgi:hypothetical protein